MKKPFQDVRIRYSTGSPPDGTVYRKVLPFRRSWKIILLLVLMDVAFLIPAFMTLGTAIDSWTQLESLFDLVMALFQSAWLLGWSLAPLIMTSLLIVLVLGREILMARPGIVDIAIGIPGLMVQFEIDVLRMRNLRQETPAKNSGKSWRGSHLVFDYNGREQSVGSNIDVLEAGKIISQVSLATGTSIPNGELETERQDDAVVKEVRPERFRALQDESPDGARTAAASFFSLSVLVLVLANLVPIAGAVYFGWDLSSVLVIYWAESGIIGFYNLCKMLVIGGWPALFSTVFFISHFGAFMAIHFLFLYGVFIQVGESSSSASLSEAARLLKALWPALLALFISHGISFFQNFIGRQEYKNITVGKQMHEPYQRIIFMHMVIIIGAGLMGFLDDSHVVLLLVMVAKIAVDVRAHLKERIVPDQRYENTDTKFH